MAGYLYTLDLLVLIEFLSTNEMPDLSENLRGCSDKHLKRLLQPGFAEKIAEKIVTTDH